MGCRCHSTSTLKNDRGHLGNENSVLNHLNPENTLHLEFSDV